jgi:hypothetical protein
MQRLLTTNLCAVRSVRLIVLIVATGLSVNIHAQTAPLWGRLDRGSFNIGFKVIYKLDHSRNWKPKYDVRGQPAVWNPSQTNTTRRLVSSQGSDSSAPNALSASREIRPLHFTFLTNSLLYLNQMYRKS